MPRRNYCWILVFVFLHCSTLLQHRSEFDKGLKLYQQSNFYEAALHFNAYYTKHPHSDTTLYYLYDCYKKLNQPERGALVLEQLVRTGSRDENVYMALFAYYHKTSRYDDLYKLLINLDNPIQDSFNERYVLTRQLYAEIICGATTKFVHSDPIVFAILEGYLPSFPDGETHMHDSITNGNLIILLDKLIEPVYPERFFKMKNIASSSFLYLPYMRLVHLGIVEFNRELDPGENAPITTAAQAVANLGKRGFID